MQVMVWGRQDSHCSVEGRTTIRAALETGKADYSFVELNARHAFIRDELSKGRYDASLANISFQLALELFRRRLTLGLGSMSNVTAQTDAPGPINC
jgi:carboxymethylenebutenolidase